MILTHVQHQKEHHLYTQWFTMIFIKPFIKVFSQKKKKQKIIELKRKTSHQSNNISFYNLSGEIKKSMNENHEIVGCSQPHTLHIEN